jgi:nucleoside-diphosphate-sugar epimerase
MLASWADVDKAKSLLGWEPRVSLLQGVARLVEWYNTERDWAMLMDTA